MGDLLIRNVQLPDRRRVDLGLADGRVAAIGPATPPATDGAVTAPGDRRQCLCRPARFRRCPSPSRQDALGPALDVEWRRPDKAGIYRS